MRSAFLFDIDGTLLDSERAWSDSGIDVVASTFGPEIAREVGDQVGLDISEAYDRAIALGGHADKAAYLRNYDEAAREVYRRAQFTEGLDRLAAFITERDMPVGLVTNSPLQWIEHVPERLPFAARIGCVISLPARPDLRPKPAPDGYIEALRVLGADAAASFVLEDSNTGIAAATAARIFTIGFRAHLLPGYEQTGADAYADSVEDVIRIVSGRTA